jgi:hypothetical protein
MNALSNVSMCAISDARTDANRAKTIALFCGRVWGASLCLAVNDLDLSAEFF